MKNEGLKKTILGIIALITRGPPASMFLRSPKRDIQIKLKDGTVKTFQEFGPIKNNKALIEQFRSWKSAHE